MKKRYVPRNLEEPMLRAAMQFPAVVLTGPRQTGKTTTLRRVFPGHAHVSLDDPMRRAQALHDPRGFLEGLGEKALIDEIQYAPELLPYIKLEIDRKRETNGRFLLAGSQVFPLMQGITESLAGRAALFELPGLCRAELGAGAFGSTPASLFATLYRGFFPEPAVHGVDCSVFYRSYVQTYLERDIRQMRSVQDLRAFQNFLELVAARAANLLNLSALGRECGVSHVTVQRWLSLLEASRLVYLLRPWHRNIDKRVVKAPKVIFGDTGLLAYLLRYQNPETLAAGPAAGAMFENFVVLEALKTRLSRQLNVEFCFFRDSHGAEADLVVDTGRRLLLLEMKLTRTLRPEHFQKLARVAALMPGSDALLVSMQREPLSFAGVRSIHWEQLPETMSTLCS